MDLYNLSEIEIELRATSDAACGDGLKALLKMKKISVAEFFKNKETHKGDFIRCCHDGFKIAQSKIIANVIVIQDEQDIINEKIKKARVNKLKSTLPELYKKKEYLEEIVILFKHCADALVWQLIQGQIYISRRLHLKVKGYKKLKEVNLKSAKNVADNINSNPNNFVLITDLTNNVQVGDIIGFIDGQFCIAEIKEGEKNFKILEIIDELNTNKTTAKEVIEKFEGDPKFMEHLVRTIKQSKTLQDVHEILSTDQGFDPISKKKIKIFSPKEDTPRYSERLSLLEKQLSQRNFCVYDVIDNCLHIGLYKGEMRFGGPIMLKQVAAKANISNYVIVDILSVLKSLNKPIYFLPFSPDLIFDLIFSRVTMFFMFDWDGYIKLFNQFGLSAEWATKKETATKDNSSIVKFKNKGIKIYFGKDRKSDMWVSHGTLTKICFEHIFPSYMAYSMHYYFNEQEQN